MIEFKAACGHTIRAKDEDEGKVVRCSYCGKEAQVPQEQEDGLDFLFSEVERSGGHPAIETSPRRSRAKKRPSRPRGSDGEFDPLEWAKKLGFIAVLIIAVLLIWKKLVPALSAASAPPPPAEVHEPPPPGPPPPPAFGLIHMTLEKLDSQKGGLYINSVPAGRVFAAKTGVTVDAAVKDAQTERFRTEKTHVLPVGTYSVYVTLPINDPTLMRFPGYPDVRRLIESKPDAEKLKQFFLPDAACQVTTTDAAPDSPRLIVRKYEVNIIEKQWVPLVALFVPDAPVDEVLRYVQPRNAFRFDKSFVEGELTYYMVPKNDQRGVMELLERLGMAVYRKPSGGSYDAFWINLTEGSIRHSELDKKLADGDRK